MAKELMYKGKTEKDFKNVSLNDYILLTNSRQRRALKRGFTEEEKRFLNKVKKFKDGVTKKIIKTHCRDMQIIPELLGLMIHVYNGKEFVPVPITVETLGHCLGEFAMTRRKVQHSAPGIGATKSSAGAVSKK